VHEHQGFCRFLSALVRSFVVTLEYTVVLMMHLSVSSKQLIKQHRNSGSKLEVWHLEQQGDGLCAHSGVLAVHFHRARCISWGTFSVL